MIDVETSVAGELDSSSFNLIGHSHLQIGDIQNQCYASSINDVALPDCPPQLIAPEDLDAVIGNATAELLAKKYYVSEFIGIKPDEQPLYNILPSDVTDDMPVDKQEEAMNFLSKIYQLIDSDDLCDKQGIRYLGKYMRHYCYGSVNYNNLNPEQTQFIDDLFQSTSPVVKLAKDWARCQYLAD